MKLGAKELRVSRPSEADLAKIKRREIYIILDNVLDTYNIGSIFRLADAVAVKCVYLCGQTETPPNPRIAKAAVGTEKWVPWEYAETAAEAILRIKDEGLRIKETRRNLRGEQGRSEVHNKSDTQAVIPAKAGIQKSAKNWILASVENDGEKELKVIAIEQAKGSKDFRNAKYDLPVAFVVGNETDGISKGALALADGIVEIPMFGVNRSLNVMVSLAIVLYQVV